MSAPSTSRPPWASPPRSSADLQILFKNNLNSFSKIHIYQSSFHILDSFFFLFFLFFAIFFLCFLLIFGSDVIPQEPAQFDDREEHKKPIKMPELQNNLPYFMSERVNHSNDRVQRENINIVLTCFGWQVELPTLDSLLNTKEGSC